MTSRLTFGGLLVAALILAFAVAAIVVLRTAGRPGVTLADGTVLTLEAVTYGREHRFDSGPFWLRTLSRLARFVPPGLRAATSSATLTRSTTNDTICFWVREQPGTAANSWRSFYVEDEAGTSLQGTRWTTSSRISPTNIFHGYGFDAFPRRGRKLFLREYDYDRSYHGRTLKASFEVRNPAPGPFPEWKPEPLPATRTDGDIKIALTRLQTGRSYQGRREGRATNAVESATLAVFHVTRHGQILTNWQPVQIGLSDATGNTAANTSWSTDSSVKDPHMLFQWGLWPDEPAWKLRVEMSRKSGFMPDELWTVRGIQATNLVSRSQYPPDTNVVARTNLSGSTLELLPLRGPGGMGKMELEIHLSPGRPGWRLSLVEVTDEKGVDLRDGGASWSSEQYQYGLKALTNGATINVTVAFHQSRFAEFLAQPEPAR